MRLLIAFAFALAAVGVATAHDFWLVPHTFHLALSDTLVVDGRTSSTFPQSLSAVTPDRVADARFLGAETESVIEKFGVAGTVLRLHHRPAGAGQHVVAAQLHPRYSPESAESFRHYLDVEGAPQLLERYDRAGILPTDSLTRSYAKYAKALVQVGEGGPRAYDRLAGHPLEFVPLADPMAMTVGDTLALHLLFQGEPLADARLHAGVADGPEATRSVHDATYTTDADGVVRVPLRAAGLWNVRALHIVPAPEDAAADWDVHWSTYVFEN